MRILIRYDDGREEEVELRKVEVVQDREGRRLSHYKYTRVDPPVILHVFTPTNEEPTVKFFNLVHNVEAEATGKVSEARKYKVSADDLIVNAKSRMSVGPRMGSCHYCGSPASNTHNGLPVCSECMVVILREGDGSKAFRDYLRRKMGESKH
jgi:hypothetical protein